jgi:hypothetical protein
MKEPSRSWHAQRMQKLLLILSAGTISWVSGSEKMNSLVLGPNYGFLFLQKALCPDSSLTRMTPYSHAYILYLDRLAKVMSHG